MKKKVGVEIEKASQRKKKGKKTEREKKRHRSKDHRQYRAESQADSMILIQPVTESRPGDYRD